MIVQFKWNYWHGNGKLFKINISLFWTNIDLRNVLWWREWSTWPCSPASCTTPSRLWSGSSTCPAAWGRTCKMFTRETSSSSASSVWEKASISSTLYPSLFSKLEKMESFLNLENILLTITSRFWAIWIPSVPSLLGSLLRVLRSSVQCDDDQSNTSLHLGHDDDLLQPFPLPISNSSYREKYRF